MKRNIITSLILLGILLGLGYYVYNKAEEEALLNKTNLSFIPSNNTFLIIEAQNISAELQNIFSSNLIWAEFTSKDSSLKNTENNINICDSLFEQNNIKLINTSVAFLSNDSNEYDFLLVSEMESPINLDSIGVKLSPNIYELEINKKKVYASVKSDRFLFSSNKNLISTSNENLLETDSSFIKVYNTKAQKNNTVFLCANISKVNDYFNLNLDKSINTSSWSSFDLKLSQDVISGNGFLLNSSLKSTSTNYSENFLDITPSSIESISVTNFNDIEELNIKKDVINHYNSVCNCDFITDGLGWIDNQVILFSTSYNKAHFLGFKLTDINSFNIAINQFTDSFPEVFVMDSSFFIKSFNSKINLTEIFNINLELNYYTIYNGYAIFGNSISNMKHLLYELNENRKIRKNEDLYSFYQANSRENSFVKKIEKGFLLSNTLSEEGVSILESSVKENNLVYTNFSYSKEINLGGNYHAPKWEILFDSPVVNSIHFVKNHKINDKDILIQDTANNLYLVSTSGSIKWKRKIDGKIIGDVNTIDIYKNNKYQMLFNTSSKIYLIDVLGRNVDDFPIKVNHATNTVSCVDYNKNGDYRFLIATKNGILNFNKDGKAITGWKIPKTKSVVLNPIRHLLANTKDYLFTNDINGKVYLFSRQGDIRHEVSSTFVREDFPVDMGNTIEESRGVYWDKSVNQLRKHFFNNEINTILTLPDSVIKFHYLNFYPDKKEKNYILETKNELYIYDKGGNTIEVLQISPEHKQLSIAQNYIAYINKVTNDFILLDKKGSEILRSSNVNYFNINDSSPKTRILLLHNNKLQMIIPKK